jgi:hypothetical protein
VIYLTGTTNDRDEPLLIDNKVGLMANPGNGYYLRVLRYPYHAAENGCFNAQWDEDTWLYWLDAKMSRERCLFAAAPDVYADAEATLNRSAKYFDLIRSLGYPVALVAQDGAEDMSLPWDDFDCLFIGGKKVNPRSAEWKVSTEAERLVREARRRGKWVHMGRVNSLLRLLRAREMGCNSCDGTFIKYRRRLRKRENMSVELQEMRGSVEVEAWMEHVDTNPIERSFETPALPVYRTAELRRAER